MERDRWLIQHFYGRDADELTWPEFIDAIENISVVSNELRPKTPAEMVVEMGRQVTEQFERARRARQAALEDN